jgi:hypothetical protein
MIFRTLLIACALSLWGISSNVLALEGREADFVTIKTVLDDPQYHLHRVRFEGKIISMTVLPNAGGCGLVDGYLFQIDDESGRIEIFDFGGCSDEGNVFAPLIRMHPVQVGDRVSIAATIQHSTIPPGILPHARQEWITQLPDKSP